MGVSGGGPYALACASPIPDRLTASALVSSLGALWLLNSLKDMVTPNHVMFTLGRVSPGLFGAILPRMVKASLPSLDKHVQAGTSPVEDLTPEIFAHLANDQSEGSGTRRRERRRLRHAQLLALVGFSVRGHQDKGLSLARRSGRP